MSLPVITLKRLTHQGNQQIGIYFERNSELIRRIRQIANSRWSATQKCWYVENNPKNLKAIFASVKGIAWVNSEGLFHKKKQETLPNVRKKRIRTKLNPEAEKAFKEFENYLYA